MEVILDSCGPRKEKSEIYGLETNVILQEYVETVGEGTPDQEH